MFNINEKGMVYVDSIIQFEERYGSLMTTIIIKEIQEFNTTFSDHMRKQLAPEFIEWVLINTVMQNSLRRV